jgi:hypothetical protein
MVTEKEGEVQETITQVKVTHIKIKIKISILEEAEGGDPMTKQAYNVITAKSMGTMNLNVERSNKINTQEEHMSQIMKETPQMGCFYHVTKLRTMQEPMVARQWMQQSHDR